MFKMKIMIQHKKNFFFNYCYFIFLLVYSYFVSQKKKKFFILPLIGYVVILIHVISGFPENNFDPLIGDTLKPIYYSFFIIIAFSFCIAEMTKNSSKVFLF